MDRSFPPVRHKCTNGISPVLPYARTYSTANSETRTDSDRRPAAWIKMDLWIKKEGRKIWKNIKNSKRKVIKSTKIYENIFKMKI